MSEKKINFVSTLIHFNAYKIEYYAYIYTCMHAGMHIYMYGMYGMCVLEYTIFLSACLYKSSKGCMQRKVFHYHF